MEQFIKQLLADKDLPTNLDDKVRAQLEHDLTSRATDFLNKRMIEALSDDDVKAFEKLIDEQPDNAVAVQEFIDKHVPNKEQLAATALLEFRALYLGKDT